MRPLLLALIVLAACGKRGDNNPAPAPTPTPPPVSAAEIGRAKQACAQYVETVCSCAQTKPTDEPAQSRCALGKALPDALELSLEVALAPNKNPEDTERAVTQVKKIAAQCIELASKFAATGC